MKKSIIVVIVYLTNMVYATTTTTRDNKSNNTTTTTTTTSFGSDAEVDAVSASISAAFGVGSAFLAYHIINKPNKLSAISSHYKNVVVDILPKRVDIDKEEYRQLVDFINKDPNVINTENYIKVINDQLAKIREEAEFTSIYDLEFFTVNEYNEGKSAILVEEQDKASSVMELQDPMNDSEPSLLTTEQLSQTVNSDASAELKENLNDSDEDNYTDKAELGDDDDRVLEEDIKDFKPIE